MRFGYLIIFLSTCFAIPIITINKDGVAIIEVDEPFEKTFEFIILDGNFTMNGSTVIPSPYLTIETKTLTSKNGTTYTFKAPFHSKIFLPKSVSVVATPNIEEASFTFDKVSLVVSRGEIYYTLEHEDIFQPNISSILDAITILLILVLFFLFKREEKQILPQKPDANILKFLTENEKTIYVKISERPGITQKELFALSGLPKSTLSVTLKRLMTKGLVERAKVGISVKLYPVKK